MTLSLLYQKRPQQHQEGLRSLLRSALNFQDHDAGPEQVERWYTQSFIAFVFCVRGSVLFFKYIFRTLFCRLLNWQQPWRLCVGDGGKVVAIMQDGSLEIRSSRDEYSSVIAKASCKAAFHVVW